MSFFPEEFSEIEQFILKHAPAVATALGGPTAGIVTSVLAGLFGTDDSKESIAKSIADNLPESKDKLKALQKLICPSCDLPEKQPQSYKINIEVVY